MTRKQDSAKKAEWKELIGEQEDFLRPIIRKVLQEVMEADMDEALGAEKGERTPDRRALGQNTRPARTVRRRYNVDSAG